MSSKGYSGTPLWKKLGFKPGMKVAVLNAPKHYRSLLEGLPEGVGFTQTTKGSDAIHVFMIDPRDVSAIAKLEPLLPPATMLWVSWPKLSSPLSKGLREDDIRKAALACGLVDVKVCAVDADWSGLKLMVRTSSPKRNAHTERMAKRLGGKLEAT
jgi:hypothetical protein